METVTLEGRNLSLNCLFGGRNNRELITELSMGSPERHRIERNTGEMDNLYHGRSGCGWECG